MNSQYGVSSPQIPYQWVWADAAARLAQAVTSSQVGFIGFQTDIALEYTLTGVSSTRWSINNDPSMGFERSIVPNGINNGTGFSTNMGGAVVLGTATARSQAITNPATMLTRLGIVTAAGAGSIGLFRVVAGNSFAVMGGARWRGRMTLGAVSTNIRYYMGMSGLPNPAADINPNTLLNSFGIGRCNGEANLQLVRNDGAGVGTQIDLGASFPAATLDSAYELEFYTFNGISMSYQVTNLTTLAAVSGVVVTDLPALTPAGSNPIYYVSNNIDAVAVALDFVDFRFWQRVS